jgi:RNA polymerase sigma factor (TIGR02999 family)
MNTTSSRGNVTRLLLSWSKGDHAALEQMLPLVYQELRRIALNHMRRERVDHTLQPTALVHEAYLRLVEQKNVHWQSSAQFFALASGMMRRILVNHAKSRQTAKRGGSIIKVPLDAAANSSEKRDVTLVALDEALDELSTLDARKGRIVELKFFGGLTTKEMAEVLQLSCATIENDWRMARAWLYRQVAATSSQGA